MSARKQRSARPSWQGKGASSGGLARTVQGIESVIHRLVQVRHRKREAFGVHGRPTRRRFNRPPSLEAIWFRAPWQLVARLLRQRWVLSHNQMTVTLSLHDRSAAPPPHATRGTHGAVEVFTRQLCDALGRPQHRSASHATFERPREAETRC